ncbi:Major intracellular serine protease [Colletotrichum higginsianum]|uniref:Major intracellular serine protease n=1 Tax=Colletotrichum higginsianum TaxID=80884 RepID=A0A4T0VH77_9PEZI|nr:Major intracellular serine protease [Colletotrichum higginsianum]
MIDTGVDYGHPALGDGMGEGYKIRYGIDLVGDNWQIGDAPRLDPDPYTECTDHGTHVSGIVAGNQSSLGFVGVASEANLEHYRVSGCNRVPIQSDIVIKAVLMAYSRKVDAVSLSLTLNTGPYPDDPLSEVLARISQEGNVLVVVASDTAVVLVRRGGCTFDVKMKNLAARGATYVLIYDNVDQPLFEFDNKFDEILGAGSVTAHVGNELMRALSEGSEVTLMMDSGFRGVPFIKVGENSLPPGQVNGRGSWGPTGLGDSMPSLLAPGQSIWSTIPRSWGGFGTLSGTSMAAPYIAGCAALVKQVHPGLSSSEISRLLTSTARPLNFNDGTNKTYNFLAPVAQQGNGVVDALGAVRTKTALSRSHLAWNDTDFFTGSASFEVQNKGNESAEYNFSHRPAVTVLALSPDGRSITPWTRDNSSSLASEEFLQNLLADRHADVTISPQSLRIGPGETALVRVTADIKTLDDLRSRCPLYSGFIYVNDGGSDDGLTISYMGIGCSMRRMVVMPPGWNKTFVTAATTKQAEGESYDAIPISPNTTFLLQGHQTPKMYLNTSTLLPTLNVELAMFSRALTVEVFPAAAADDDRGVSVFSPDQAAKPGGFGRSTTNLITWSGQLENGSWADEGLYKFKVCALRAWERTSGPQAQKDCVVTAPFGIEYDG